MDHVVCQPAIFEKLAAALNRFPLFELQGVFENGDCKICHRSPNYGKPGMVGIMWPPLKKT